MYSEVDCMWVHLVSIPLAPQHSGDGERWRQRYKAIKEEEIDTWLIAFNLGKEIDSKRDMENKRAS